MASEASPLLIIRADADGTIGSGHVMRCLALASEWRERGGEAVFWGRIGAESLRQRIVAEGFRLRLLPASHPEPSDKASVATWLCEERERFGSVLLDGYHFDAAYHDRIRASGWPLLVIDDFAHLPAYHADILLNPNAYADELSYRTNPEALRLLGSHYTPLRREFRLAREQEHRIAAHGQHILVTMGGADPDNISGRVVDALLAMGDNTLDVKLVIGPLNPHRPALVERLAKAPFQVELLTSVTDMASLMLWADLAISASGSTCWELAVLGVPMLVTVLADNQERLAASLVSYGVAVSLGWPREWRPEQAASVLKELLGDSVKRRSMGEAGRRLVDGMGCARVIERIFSLQADNYAEKR